LRQPEGLAQVDPGAELKATLRPYQQAGLRWLYLLVRLRLGACLADDMGLGKTIQVLALLLVLKREQQDTRSSRPSVLIAPASLLANWVAEAERFAPSLRLLIAHSSAMPAAELRALDGAALAGVDLVVTSYGSLLRSRGLEAVDWQLAVIDEAQAIKNPAAKQTRQVKQLKADARIALTGTPVENRLSDLWSIFDFTHPGLLGSSKAFADFSKRMASAEHFGPLRTLVRPYILRRLKTDKRVISDLPDKTEVKAWCHLSPAQAALYQRSVQELAAALEDAEGIGRRGVVLAFLMRFKQICNHPSQWLGDDAWSAADSGKFARLRELAEVIAAKQEKVLVFTQFRETTEPLAAFLGAIFGREGLVLHGGTPVAKRRELVKRFQEDELTPFFVLSLKAGGAGLNLTAASHVIHFDRWWNPAVENQATDRVFRIGQQRNVLVHKFVCRGTIEDRIDQLIESKRQLADDVLEGGAEMRLTEMSDRELLDLVKLDLNAAQES
jgi:non-specific serine/threonine protein kinase